MRSLNGFSKRPETFTARAQRKALLALREDASADVTTVAMNLKSSVTGRVIAKESGVFCGLPEAQSVFRGLKVRARVREGQRFRKGRVLLEVRGDVRRILAGERTALNYLMVLSGIATATRALADRFGPRIASLRKTHPLLSDSEKRAVKVGGGLTHRLSLADGYLIKENHVAALAREQRVSYLNALRIAVQKVRGHRGKRSPVVEVEVRSMREALAAAEERPDALLLDNLSPYHVRRIARVLRRKYPSLILEASGGITEKNASSYLKAGADFVSSSALTLRAKPIDLSLLFEA
ncbi:carboxylating nicotinate-nucleotide diphosphorylase [Candidatus Micrarchaeota archaeon]|nr:carboxylating nicotinate-nucleotide diphosphorylase [Candidatus Micrarchaeota archaeon]